MRRELFYKPLGGSAPPATRAVTSRLVQARGAAATTQLRPAGLSETQQEFDLVAAHPGLKDGLYMKQVEVVREIFSMIDVTLSDRDVAALFGAFGSVHGILGASLDALRRHLELDTRQFKFLSFMNNITWKLIGSSFDFRLDLSSPRTFREYLRHKYASKEVQLAVAIYVDGAGRLIHESVEKGTIGRVHLSAQSIGREALVRDADGVVFARTTGCQNNRPTMIDIRFDGQLSAFLETVRIRFIDYLIVGRNGVRSIRNESITSPPHD